MNTDTDVVLEALWARWQRQHAEIEALPGYPEEAVDALTTKLIAIEGELCDRPSQGWRGLLIKARLCEYQLDQVYCGDDAATAAFRSLVNDVLVLAEGKDAA